MLQSSINHAIKFNDLITKLKDPELTTRAVDFPVLYSRLIEDCRQCIFTSNGDDRVSILKELSILVAKSPKLFLPCWNQFISLFTIEQMGISQLTDFFDFWKIAVRGSTGILKSRTRYTAKNKVNSRSFTSLSETIVCSIRSLWFDSICVINTKAELSLEFMQTVSKYNCLGGFLTDAELLDLLEHICWDHLEVFPRISMQIACNAAQSLRSIKKADVYVDNGLALRYISSSSKQTGLDLIGPFFTLLDVDDEDVWLTALSLLAPYVGEEKMLVSLFKIIDIILSTSVQNTLLQSIWDVHLLPLLDQTPTFSDESISYLLKCISVLSDKFDFDASHQVIVETICNCYGRGEKILAQIYQVIGVFASPNYSFSIDAKFLNTISTCIIEGPDHPKRIWAAANLVSNPEFVWPTKQLTILSQLVKNRISSVDDVERTSSIRCDLEIAFLFQTVDNFLGRIESLLEEEVGPKVLWTCANSIKRVADKGHKIPSGLVTKLIVILETTSYYKVAISVVQCLSAIRRHQASWDRVYTERIQAALTGQRFTITDSYSEMYQQSLRNSNAELLSLLDRLCI